ncbi:hypothetical protein HID58_090080 [Brassica napus]|uniref:Uncharacterized protein n=1 Tax=Brassica napus TaxID=3708 RepID=A0ABQ7XE77_BRANA|nr:hypothetical protein HID58_090080 [Brassica napus]
MKIREYGETAKIRASKLQKKHPRCLADGNELLRFHGTTRRLRFRDKRNDECLHGRKCCVCRIIRNGFSAKREKNNNGVGVFTASTSGRAFESVLNNEGDVDRTVRKVLMCGRVVAGRVHRPVENVEEMNGLMMSGFDSLAGKGGLYTNVEELYLLNPRALLPCFTKHVIHQHRDESMRALEAEEERVPRFAGHSLGPVRQRASFTRRFFPEPEGPVPTLVTGMSSSPPAGVEPGSMTIGPQGSNQ